MAEPRAARPHMPGYGMSEDAEGMLSWAWVADRLASSHDYWVATVRPDGRPHVMPVWGAWIDDCLWFSSDQGSRKARNLVAEPRCVVTTADPLEPVVLDGVAEPVLDRSGVARFVDVSREKYASEWIEDLYTVDFFDGNLGGGGTYRVRPTSVFALRADEFTSSPTRWTF